MAHRVVDNDGGRDQKRADPRVLVVEDNPAAQRCLKLALRTCGPVAVAATIAGSVAEAERALAGKPEYAGFLVDIQLPDGSGLDVAARCRESYPRAPVLIVSGSIEPEHINFAQRLGARYLGKPYHVEDLQLFVRCLNPSRAVEDAVSAFASRHSLGDVENNVLRGAVINGEDYAATATRRRCSPHTIRAHAASILKKSGYPSMHEIVDFILRDAAGLNEWL